MAGTILLVCLVLVLGSAKAQNVAVTCFMGSDSSGSSGSGDVTATGGVAATVDCPSGEGFSSTYAECCTGENPEMTMYTMEGEDVCIPCGPVLDEEAVIPFAVELTTIVLQWELANGSMEANRFRVTNQQEGSLSRFPSTVRGGNSVQFIGLFTGTSYTFRVRADNTGKDTSSPMVTVTWIAGESPFPTFTNFTLESLPSIVRVTWELELPGVRPMDQMIASWVQLLDGDEDSVQIDEGFNFTADNRMIFEFNETNPAIIGQSFFVDIPIETDNQYAVEIRGINVLGSSQTLFAFDSNDTSTFIIEPVGIRLSGLVNRSSLLVTLLLVFLAIYVTAHL